MTARTLYALQRARISREPMMQLLLVRTDRAETCRGCRAIVLPDVLCWQLTRGEQTTTWCPGCWPTGSGKVVEL